MCINNNNCGSCNQCQPTICNQCPPSECECSIRLSSDCITYTGDTLTCSGIEKDTILTDVIIQLDAYICQAISDINAAINLINIGEGAQIYRGIDGIGRREIRTITKTGDLITVTQNTEDIEISIDEVALNTFVEENQKTYSIDNVGTGAEIYKIPDDVVGDNTDFNLKTLKLSSVGDGTPLIKDIDTTNVDELNFRMKGAISDSLIITEDGDDIRFEIPSSEALPDFIVNQDFPVTYDDWLKANANDNGGTPVIGYEYKGYGTMAKPFVDTHVFTLGFPATPPVITANTSIQNGLDAYVGSGTKINPEFFGSRIKIQRSNTQYIFTGNVNYHGVKFNLQPSTAIKSEPASLTGEDSWFVNLDHSEFGIDDAITPTIELELDSFLEIRNNGFKNKGTTINNGLFTQSKNYYIKNAGSIAQTRNIEDGDTAGDFVLFNNNGEDSAGYFNDSNGLCDVRGGSIRSTINPIMATSKTVTDFKNVEFIHGQINSDIDPTTIPFESFEGAYCRMERCQFYVVGNDTIKALFKSTGNESQFLLVEPLVNGTVGSLVEINTHLTDPLQDPRFTMYNGTNLDGFTCVQSLFEVNLFGGRTDKWNKVYFNNNYISKATVDIDKVDLTAGNNQGVINFIGRSLDTFRQIVEFLPRFISRASALSVMDRGTRFIKYTTVTAGSFVVGEEYKILTVGTTDFTLIGASANTVGTWFVATGVGAGDGTADKEIVEILT